MSFSSAFHPCGNLGNLLKVPTAWRVSPASRDQALAVNKRKQGIKGPKNSRCDQLLKRFD